MSSSVSTTVDGVVVVTHVHPAPQGAGPQHGTTLQRFSRSQPLVLGTVQIMIGLIILLFGIAMTVYADSRGVFSVIFVWGAAFYIIAGSLTVAAGKYLTRSLVNAALVLCVIAAVASATGTILYSLDATGVMWYCYNGYDGRNDCYRYKTRMHGVSGALAVFNLLELIVSITIAGYACSATCNCTQEPPSVVYVPAASVGARDAPSAQEAIGDAIDFCSQMLENSSAMLDNSSAMLDNSFVI
ncbi:membrane-spanning 4-domains subfamily A member 4A-like isoform X1 [Scophthalmus maximus]|uniref:membrane-spanning 4-domains subfamily A member 4A-like isoform X1 n=1 Tax=Scophthalmus maximus TaxID=52904 RepID=UPI001FA8458A|nr:membrane-spanning 4-domains subfamily A member 4A-like isoform X1 [Scophthalmus maximus]